MHRYLHTIKASLHFKKWSRKRFAILLSLGRVVHMGVLCTGYGMIAGTMAVSAQPDSVTVNGEAKLLEEIEVAGYRGAISQTEVARTVALIRHEDFSGGAPSAVFEVLEFLSPVDARQRGPFGVQTDLTLRGGGFDHVMVLINGINANDPQTGHFSADLPVDPEIVERIEVLQGPGTRSLGPGAFSGAVNIVTKKVDKANAGFNLTGGQHGLRRGHLHAGFGTGRMNHMISGGYSASDGYRPNTDFQAGSVYYNSSYKSDEVHIEFQTGYRQKSFGAAGYYSPKFPDQYEENSMWFASIRTVSGSRNRLSNTIYFRTQKDHFRLIRNEPVQYNNYHLNEVWGIQSNLTRHCGPVTLVVGGDFRGENILSNNLGTEMQTPVKVRGADSATYSRHDTRSNVSIFVEGRFRKGRFFASGGVLLNRNTAYARVPVLFPGLDAGFRLADYSKIYVSYASALHVPTFTDLYYKDPVNEGNLNLRPNRMQAVELGFQHKRSVLECHANLFINHATDMIDWLWSFESNRFGASNVKSFLAGGAEAFLAVRNNDSQRLPGPLRSVSFRYQYIHVSKSVSDSLSKYHHLKHKLALTADHRLFWKFFMNWTASYQQRAGHRVEYDPVGAGYIIRENEPVWLIHSTVSLQMKHIQVFAKVTNLLNRSYIEAGSAIQPGRWFAFGISYDTANLTARH